MRDRIIQARVSKDTIQELTFLQDTLGVQSVTEIITLSIHHLALEHRQQKAKQSPFQALEELELIGTYPVREKNCQSLRTSARTSCSN